MSEDIFSHEAVEAFRAEVAALLKHRKMDFEPAVKKIKAQLKDVDIKISNLIDVLETKGLESSLVTNRLADLEQRRSKLEKDLGLQMSHTQDVEPFIPRAVDRFHELIANLPESCKEHTAPVTEKLSSLLGGQVMLRKSEHGGWEGTYRGSYAGLIRLGAAHIEISDETLSRAFLMALVATYSRYKTYSDGDF